MPPRLRLGTFDTDCNVEKFILLRLVPGELYGFAWDKLKKLIRPLDDARKMGEAFCGHTFNLDGSPPFFAVPGLHGSLAPRFIHVTDDSHLVPLATLCPLGGTVSHFPPQSGFPIRNGKTAISSCDPTPIPG